MVVVFSNDPVVSDIIHVALDDRISVKLEHDVDAFLRWYGALEYPASLIVFDCRGNWEEISSALAKVSRRMRGVPVVAVVDHADSQRAFAVGDRGVAGWIPFPCDTGIARARILSVLGSAVVAAGQGTRAYFKSSRLVGRSPAVNRLRELVARAADSRVPVMILGETGAGKEIVARSIHEASPVAGGPFVATNVAAIASGVFESELFGARRGAFTGAVDREGLFQASHGGTLFIDEVAELPLELQPKLLRAAETRTVRPVGGSQPVKVDTRIIAATNRTREELRSGGLFRDDLWYRLAGIVIPVPPLRARKEDIGVLAYAILDQEGYTDVELAGSALERLRTHDWPGNVRELAATLARSIALTGKKHLRARDIFFDESSILE